MASIERNVDDVSLGMLALMLLGVASLYATVVPSMIVQWSRDSNFSHGFVVPVYSAYLVWERRNGIAVFPRGDVALPGLLLILAGVVLLVIGKAAGELFTSRCSLILVIGGMCRIALGRQGFRTILFPWLFLFFMVPIPYILYDAIAFPLRMGASWFAEFSLNAVGIPVLREGNVILLPHIQLEVADACSGIRSLMSLVAISTAVSPFFGLGFRRGSVLAASSVGVAIALNFLRIFLTGVLSNSFGQRAAEGFFHEFSGLVISLAGMVILILFGLALKPRGPGKAKEAA